MDFQIIDLSVDEDAMVDAAPERKYGARPDGEGKRARADPADSDMEPEEIKAKGFDFRGKNVGLTYAQCDLTMEELYEGLLVLPTQAADFDKFVIGQEHHNDGGQHFHVYLHYPKAVHATTAAYWDVEGYHPNIKRFGAKKVDSAIDRWISYCKKEGRWEQGGFLEVSAQI